MTVISSNFVAVLLIITLAIAIHLIVRYRELHAADPDGELYPRVRDTVQLDGRPVFLYRDYHYCCFCFPGCFGHPAGYRLWLDDDRGYCGGAVLSFILVPCLMLVWPEGRPHHTPAGSTA